MHVLCHTIIITFSLFDSLGVYSTDQKFYYQTLGADNEQWLDLLPSTGLGANLGQMFCFLFLAVYIV